MEALRKLTASLPTMPAAEEIRNRAAACLWEMEKLRAGATLEQRRDLIGGFVHSITAEPDRQVVRIKLFPPAFSQKVTRVGLEPTTNGLKGRCSTN